MKISILTPDLSHNCLGRAYLLAKILQRRYEVEIVGPIFGDGIWEPVASLADLKYNTVKMGRVRKSYFQIGKLLEKVEGDVIYASKPLLTSFGIAILSTTFNKKPIVLDIDDWEIGLMKESFKRMTMINRIRALAFSTLAPHQVESYWNYFIGDKLIFFAKEITVSGRFIQHKFGGDIVWHARDTQAFDPDKYDKELIRNNLGISQSKKIVMFFGTPRVHKGLEDLIEAISLLKNSSIVLMIIGIDKDDYSNKLTALAKNKLGDNFMALGVQGFEKVPEFLAIADVVAIPQRNNSATVGQVPAKVFDAMAMAKPTIATAVSDLPEILDGCGWIVEPEQPEQLAQNIEYILAHSEEAEEMGQKARVKCIENYSWDAMESVLSNIFDKYR